MSNLKEKAEQLLQLHHGSQALIFANAWDVASARLLEEMGFPAVATSSAAIANSLGYADGQRVERNQMLEVAARIAAAVEVPVTVDLEAGYASSGKEMEESARALLDAGAVGLNLEDSFDDESQLTELPNYIEKIQALRAVSSQRKVHIVINTRTDAYWWKGSRPETRMAATVERANAFRKAGADCVFVPGLKQPDEIAEFLRQSPGLLNILAVPGSPTLPELQSLGVARISLGSGPYRAAIGLLRALATELLAKGTFSSMTDHAIPFADMNRLFE